MKVVYIYIEGIYVYGYLERRPAHPELQVGDKMQVPLLVVGYHLFGFLFVIGHNASDYLVIDSTDDSSEAPKDLLQRY